MNSECRKDSGAGDSAVVHATAWSYGRFAELKAKSWKLKAKDRETTNSTKDRFAELKAES